MDLILYYAPMTCALVPYVALTEAGAPFEAVNVNTRTNAHRTPKFLALNPKHKVPVLVIDGEPLTENLAIQIWIAREFPQARLLPADPPMVSPSLRKVVFADDLKGQLLLRFDGLFG